MTSWGKQASEKHWVSTRRVTGENVETIPQTQWSTKARRWAIDYWGVRGGDLDWFSDRSWANGESELRSGDTKEK